MSKTAEIRLTSRSKGFAYGGGFVTGILAWLFGDSSIPIVILEYGPRLSYIFLLAVMLAMLAQWRCWNIGQPLDLFAEKISQWSVNHASKAIFFMSGTCSVALICWQVTGSIKVLGFVLVGLGFIGALSYFSWAINLRLQVFDN